MNLFTELRKRRVPQILSGYFVGSWGLIQFLEFLEGRMTITPNLVNLVGIGLILFLPSVLILAWVHGQPGRDSWGRSPKILLPTNLLAVGFLFFMFRGQALGTVTETIEVQDENGEVSVRVIPKSQFRRRVLIFYPENTGPEADNWARETLNALQGIDLYQDVFVDPVTPMAIENYLQEAGCDDGHGLTRVQQRKIATEGHFPYFLTSTLGHENGSWVFDSELHNSESGRIMATRHTEAAGLYKLTDLTSREIREDLGIPVHHLETSRDLPVADLSSNDLEAVKSYVQGLIAVTHFNDWALGGTLFDAAVERDSGFASAQFLRFAVYQALGQMEKSNEAIATAMDNLDRVSERRSFMIKAQYYYNVKQDADKSLAVLGMWSQLYPNDVEAYSMQSLFYYIRQDLPRAIEAKERILAIDPSQVKLIREIANFHQQLGNNAAAEANYLKYVELFPTDTKGYRDLAGFYGSTGELDKAKLTLEKAQLIDPGELDLVLGLVGVKTKSGLFAESQEILDKELARAKTPRDRAMILSRRISLLVTLGQTDQVVLDLDQLHNTLLEFQSPMQADLVMAILVPRLSEMGQSEEALRRLVVLAGKIPPPYDQLVGLSKAWTLANLGRPQEARVFLTEAAALVETMKFETYRSTLAMVEGKVNEAEGNFEAAVGFFRSAKEKALAPESLHSVSLGRVLRKNGDPKEAKKVLEEALALNPAQPALHLEMALTWKDLGNSAKAQEHLRLARTAWPEAHPDFRPALQARQLAGEIN